MPPSLEQVVAGIPLFAGMKQEHIVEIAGCSHPVRFESDEYVGRVGDPADGFWAVLDGRVVLEARHATRGPLPVMTVGPGEVLGWSWLVPPHQWHLDARALTTTHALVFDVRRLRGKFADDYELGYELLRRFAQLIAGRLEAAGSQLHDPPIAHG